MNGVEIHDVSIFKIIIIKCYNIKLTVSQSALNINSIGGLNIAFKFLPVVEPLCENVDVEELSSTISDSIGLRIRAIRRLASKCVNGAGSNAIKKKYKKICIT